MSKYTGKRDYEGFCCISTSSFLSTKSLLNSKRSTFAIVSVILQAYLCIQTILSHRNEHMFCVYTDFIGNVLTYYYDTVHSFRQPTITHLKAHFCINWELIFKMINHSIFVILSFIKKYFGRDMCCKLTHCT